MYVRGKGVEFAKVAAIIAKVSAETYGGNIIVHQDASPISKRTADRETMVVNGYMRAIDSNVNGYGFKGRIIGATSSGMGTRKSWSGRRGPWACWHAYRDVMRAIFAEYPHAVITSAMARYEGSDGFENTYPATANRNIGSMASPAYASDLCDCNDCE